MTNPVPGHNISTPYGKRGPHWSCSEDANGNGIHTGADYVAPSGTPVVAARGGKVVHCNHGSAFGSHQIEILPGDGTRDFYAHMSSRVGNGTKVSAGQKVGAVGSEGNATGPHLHFERHKVATGGWSCGVIVNPQPSIDAGTSKPPTPDTENEDEEMFIFRTNADADGADGKGAAYLVFGTQAVQVSTGWSYDGDPVVIKSSSEEMDNAFYESVTRHRL